MMNSWTGLEDYDDGVWDWPAFFVILGVVCVLAAIGLWQS